MRRKVEIEAWFYILLLFNSAVMGMKLLERIAGLVD